MVIDYDPATYETVTLDRFEGQKGVVECTEAIPNYQKHGHAHCLGKIGTGVVFCKGNKPPTDPLDENGTVLFAEVLKNR
jgi:hypothetical protein